MNKRLIFIFVILASFTSTLLAQITPEFINSFNQSAKSYSTFGLAKSESDYINARDIFNVDRMFFSAGYLPSLGGAGGNDGVATGGGSIESGSASTMGQYSDFYTSNTGTMSAYMASPVRDGLTVGLAAEYKMYSTREEYTKLGGTTRDWSMPGWQGRPGNHTIVATDVLEQIRKKEYSDFNIIATVMVEHLALHYHMARSGYTQTTENNIYNTHGMGVASGTRIDNDSIWQHEFGFTYKGDSFKIYTPVGLILDKYIMTSSATDALNRVDSEEAKWLYINPEVTIDMDMGVLKEIVTGIDSTFLLKYAGITSYRYTDFDLYVKPVLEHQLWEDKIDLLLETTVGVDLVYDHTAHPIGTYYDVYIDPYIDIDFATLVRPLEWLELRFGLNYKLDWDCSVSRHFERYSTSLEFIPTFGLSSGIGINLGDYFSIDIYVQTGQSVDNLASGTLNDDGEEVGSATDDSSVVSATSSLFSINSYGLQLTYRF